MDSKRPNDQGRYLSKSAEQSSEPGCGLKTVTLPLPLYSNYHYKPYVIQVDSVSANTQIVAEPFL